MTTTPIKKWATKYIDDSGARQVTLTIGETEKLTSGEVVAIVAKSSSATGHIPFLLTLIFTTLGFVFYIPEWKIMHFPFLQNLWPVFILFYYLISIPISKLHWVQRILTSKNDQELQVFRRAQSEFAAARIAHTEKSTGVLIFVSLMEHRTLVLADHGIASKLPADAWKEVCDLVIAGIKEKDLAKGLKEGIRLSGSYLKKEFPAEENNKNELANELQFLE